MEQNFSTAELAGKLNAKPEVGLILGSGLGDLANRLAQPVTVPYCQVPGMPLSTAPGHAGQFVAGYLAGKYVLCMQGRLHAYEGYSMGEIAYPIRLMKLLGINRLVITNACGAVNRDFAPGDICIITDHINFLGGNPLTGPNLAAFGPRFCDMSQDYTPALREAALAAGERLGVPLRQGVYLGYAGPSYETPAEIRAFRVLGADLVGMSTVPEVIAAHHCGMEVLALGLVTNMAAGVTQEKLSEAEVIRTAAQKAQVLQALVTEILANG